MHTKFCSDNTKRRRHQFGNMGVDERIILKLSFMEFEFHYRVYGTQMISIGAGDVKMISLESFSVTTLLH
jgi:hypothetical protein